MRRCGLDAKHAAAAIHKHGLRRTVEELALAHDHQLLSSVLLHAALGEIDKRLAVRRHLGAAAAAAAQRRECARGAKRARRSSGACGSEASPRARPTPRPPTVMTRTRGCAAPVSQYAGSCLLMPGLASPAERRAWRAVQKEEKKEAGLRRE